jgi:ketosteroid isomerase-like protein
MKLKAKSFLTCSLFLFILLAGCENTKRNRSNVKPVKLTGKDAEVQKKLEKISEVLNKAVIENDYETQLKFFTDDAVIIPPLGPVVKGKSEIEDGFEKNEKEHVVVRSFNAEIEDLWICGDKVCERGKWALSQTTRRSKVPKAYNGSYFMIWKAQQDSSLLIDYNIFTLDFNPYEEH